VRAAKVRRGRRLRALGAAVVALLVVLVATAGAQAPAPLRLTLGQTTTGWISAHVSGPPGTVIGLDELTGDAAEPVQDVTLSPAGTADVVRLAAWRCDRRTRTFALTSNGQQVARAEIRTPSCRDRLALTVSPGRPRAGRRTTVQLRDRWRTGDVAARVCLVEPGGAARRCRTLRLGAGETRAAVRMTPRRAGRWAITVGGRGLATMRRGLHVRPPARRLRVLAAGDSMIQILDGFLRERLEARTGVTVRSDAHISTGISKPFMLNWPSRARATAQTLHPDVTVVFLGANDGFPMGTRSGPKAPCCTAAWVDEYARRAGTMMRAYARGGEGTVYWLLLPAPRDASFRKVFGPVNRALRQAARAHPGTVRLVDLGATFTPGGRFRERLRWRGRTVTVRQEDGVHLSIDGASIAAELVVRAMRRDGVVR
jgi:lysophospholipase L1-like esterase